MTDADDAENPAHKYPRLQPLTTPASQDLALTRKSSISAKPEGIYLVTGTPTLPLLIFGTKTTCSWVFAKNIIFFVRVDIFSRVRAMRFHRGIRMPFVFTVGKSYISSTSPRPSELKA